VRQAFALVLLAACSSGVTTPDSGMPDAGSPPDAGPPVDSGVPDAGAPKVEFVQAAGASTTSVAFVSPQVAGDLNVVVMGWGDDLHNITGVSDTLGNIYKPGAVAATSSGTVQPYLRQAVYYARNIAEGANTVTVTFDGAPMFPDLKVLEYRGAGPFSATSSAFGDTSSGTASSGQVSVAAGALIVGAGMTTDRFSGAGSGFVARVQSNDGNIVEDQVAPATGHYDATLTLSSNAQSWVMQVVTFGPPSPDGGVKPDGGVRFDAGMSPDAGAPTDAGVSDGGPSSDGGRMYATSFAANENPISEGGNWLNGLTDGLDWADVQTQGGVAHGTVVSLGPPYNDTTAVLKGPWSDNQAACATVHLTNPTSSVFEEVELRLRTSISAHSINGYEFNFRAVADGNQYVQIVRWNGPLNSFAYVSSVTGPGIHDGDRICATADGSTLAAYINDAGVVSGTDTMFPSGAPGIGFYMQNGTTQMLPDYGFTQFTAWEL
jgi:hypothetical protein